MPKTLTITVGYHSDRGAKPENQDFCGWMAPREPLLTTKGVAVLLADGVSGCDAGAEASEFSVKGFLNDYFSTPESWPVKLSGRKVLTALNNWLYSEGHRPTASRRGLVTTFSAVVFKSNTAHLFHVGDSRIVWVRDDGLETVTRPHRVRVSPHREYLSRALGMDTDLEIDYRTLTLKAGDRFLLLTDGVGEYVDDRTLLDRIAAHGDDPAEAARRICDAAIANQSPDNVTCMVARVDALPSQEADEVYRELTALPFPPELEPGMRLDGYFIQKALHASPTSQLYLASDERDGRRVVLKTPSVSYEDDPAYIERFLHEEWAGKRIDHPHVLKLLEPGHRRRFLYLVMEHLPGRTLREWITGHPRPEISAVREMLDQITAGLRAFHRLEMLHRDLKPENILIDERGRIKLIDFGSVKIAGIAEIATPVQRAEILGTRSYTAPEYFQGRPGSKQSDIYSLGIVAYEMLTGHTPFGEPGNESRKKMVEPLVYTSALIHNPMIPGWMDGALKKATSPDPNGRYETLSEFLQDFSHPNPRFLDQRAPPLLEANPLLFWRTLAGVLFLLNLVLFYLLAAR